MKSWLDMTPEEYREAMRQREQNRLLWSIRRLANGGQFECPACGSKRSCFGTSNETRCYDCGERPDIAELDHPPR